MHPIPAPLGMFESKHTIAELVEAFAHFASFANSGRFGEYYSALKKHAESGRPFSALDDQERPTLRHAFAEAQEFLTIATCIASNPLIRNAESELRRLLGGDFAARAARHYLELAGSQDQAREVHEPAHLTTLIRTPIEDLRLTEQDRPPENQDREEAPRNAAFELWLACPFKKAGINLEKVDPDWCFSTQMGRIAIEAKRVQSVGAIYKKTDEAAAQIEKQVRKGNARYGIVAIDLTLAFDLHRKQWIIRRPTESRELHAAVSAVMNDQRKLILDGLAGRDNVIAAILHAKAMAFVREDQSFMTVRPLLFALVVSSEHPTAAWFQGLVQAMNRK